VRRLLYNWHPSRARRWRASPGLERLAGARAVLTFDDGPGADATPRVLDQLGSLGVSATFFVLGAAVLREPELARRIVADGHELGVHGFAHPRFDLLTAAQARADLEQGLEAIETTTGVRPSWFRPPYGKLSDASYEACRALDLKVAYWSAWGLDWEEIGTGAISDEVISGLSAGAVILLHDTARYGRRSSATPTADALPRIVAHGERLGLTWSTLTEAAREPS
jgi:peptidoglycan/xylan/chitin deacetylase (PgdA/CDA1 family)